MNFDWSLLMFDLVEDRRIADVSFLKNLHLVK